MGVVYNFPKVVEMARTPLTSDNLSQGYVKGTLWLDTSANKGDGVGWVLIYSDDFRAEWRITSLFTDKYSIDIINSKVALVGDVPTSATEAFHYYGTDVDGTKGWHSLGGVAAEELEIISSSSNLYRLLLHDSTYKKCHYDLFGSSTAEKWTGTPVNYVGNTFTYEISSGAILQTGNIMEQGTSTDSFYWYVETDIPYVAEYSTDNVTWTEFFPTSQVDGEILTELPRVELNDTYTTLYIKTTFDSSGNVLSFGCLYEEEQGVYSFFSEAFFNIHYHYLVGASATEYDLSSNVDVSASNWQTELEYYGQGLLNTTNSYYSSAGGFITLGTTAAPLTASEEDALFKTYQTEGHNYVQYIDSIHTATQGQTLFSVGAFNFEPGKNEVFIFINGVRQYPTSYTELAGNRVSFDTGLDSGDEVVFRVWKRNGRNVRQEIAILTATEAQTQFQLVNKYVLGYTTLNVYIDGVHQEPVEAYTEINTNTIQFTEGLSNGSQVMFGIIKYQ